MKNIILQTPINLFLKLNELEINTFTVMRKIVTIKLIINRILVKPYRTETKRLDTGVLIEILYYNNKKIIKVKAI